MLLAAEIPFMQKVILTCLFLVHIASFSFAQNKTELDMFLKTKNVSKAAKDYYQGKFKASDDARTFSILDSMETTNSQTRQFYLYLATQMMQNSDGALSEELGLRAKDYVEQHPNWALVFLQGKFASPTFNNLWAKRIAGEIMIDCEGKERKCAKEWYDSAEKKTDSQYKLALKTLYDQVSKQCP